MTETPHALIKDLLSTGYFFEQLKRYSLSKEIDLPSFSRGFAIPYLTMKCESYQALGKANRARIIGLALKFLQEASDDDMADTIVGIKKAVECEVDAYEKALHRNEALAKSDIISYRQQLEEAQSLGKMLVSIIKTFKLSEAIVKRDKSDAVGESVCEVIKGYWEPLASPVV